MNYSNNSWSNDPGDNSWQSGIKFVEEKKPKRFLKVLGLVLLVFFSASIGGIFGGYYVRKNYAASYYDGLRTQDATGDNIIGETPNNLKQLSQSANIPKNSITKVAEMVGPAVVGVDNNIRTWGGTALQGSGSGIIFDKPGYIVTNEHVIEDASSVTVTLPGGRKVPARIVGKDSKSDLAVLKINVDNLPVAKFGDSSKIRVGDVAIAIGNPLGEALSGSVTVGVISALNRSMNVDGREYKVIQTDASINPGNSGGALCNEAGEVIGINSLKISSAEGIGFAISINEARPIIEALIKNGYVARPSLGIIVQFVDQDMSQLYEVPVGVYIQDVMTQNSSEKSPLIAGDIIVNLDGKDIKSDEDLSSIIDKHKIGDVIAARVWRDGKYENLKIKLGESFGQ